MSEVSLTADAYQVKEALDDLRQLYMPDEDDETLELGLYGWLSSAISKEIASTIRVTAEMNNEMFIHKARLESSIISHAITNNITDIFATPAVMPCFLCITEKDLQNIIDNQTNPDSTLEACVIDNMCKIMIGDYEYHFDYPIKITKTKLSGDRRIYTAIYDTSDKNTLSDITNPYLASPYILKTNGESQVFIPTQLRQYIVTKLYNTLSSDNIIENKFYQFTFDNQLAAFDVYVKDGDDSYRLTPIFESATPENGVENWCKYTFINENTIRVTFDSNSIMPGIGAEITTVVKTTLGATCNFPLTENFMAVLQDTEDYSYLNTSVTIRPQDKSDGGLDKVSISDLKKATIREAASRHNLTSYSDLTAFFNKLNTADQEMVFKEKVNNQFMFQYYSYILAKDSIGNIVPTNTIDAIIDSTFSSYENSGISKTEDNSGRDIYIINPGACFGQDGKLEEGTATGTRVAAATLLKDESYRELDPSIKFSYSVPFKMVIDPNVPCVFYYMNIMDKTYLLDYSFNNEQCPVQFICNSVTWRRDPSLKPEEGADDLRNKYILNLSITQNIEESFNIVYEKPETDGDDTTEDPENQDTDDSEENPDNSDVDTDDSSDTENFDDSDTDDSSEDTDQGIATFSLNDDSGFETAAYNPPDNQKLVDDYINTNKPSIALKGISAVFGGTANAEKDNTINENNILGQIRTADYNMYQNIESDDPIQQALNEIEVIDSMGANTTLNTSKNVTKVFDPEDQDINMISNIKVILVCKDVYNEKETEVRFFDSVLVEPPEEGDYTYNFTIQLETDDYIGENNRIRISNGYKTMSSDELNSENTVPFYFNENTPADIYVLVRFLNEEGNPVEYGRDNLDQIISSKYTEGYSVTNRYKINGGIDFLENFSDIVQSNIDIIESKKNEETNSVDYKFRIYDVPMLKYSYVNKNKDLIGEFITKIKKQKAHIDNMLKILDNAFTIDFKFFNTYGPSARYTVDGSKYIGKVNISIKLNVKLKKAIDDYTIEYIKRDIKEYIESFDNIGQDIHFPVIISELIQKYSNSVYYIEYQGFNIEYTSQSDGVCDCICDNCGTSMRCENCKCKNPDGTLEYGPDCQHLLYDSSNIDDIPEFINIDSSYDESTGTFSPNIVITTN